MKIGKQFLVALWATISAAIMTVGLAIVVPTAAHADIATSYNVTWEVPEGTPKYEIYTSVPEGTYKARLTDTTTGLPLAPGTQVYATWPTLWNLDDGTGPTKRAQERQAVLESCDRYIWDSGDIQHRECYGYNDPGAYPRRLVTVGEGGYVTFPTFAASNDWKTLFQFYASGTQGTKDMIGVAVRFTVIPGEPFPESSYLFKEATEEREVGQTMVYTTPTLTTDQYEEQVFYAIPHDRYWNNYHGQDYKGWNLGDYVYVSNSVGRDIAENNGPYFSIQNRNWEAITGSVKPVADVPAGFEWIEEPKWVPERGAFEGKYRAKWPGERQIPNTAEGGEGPADESLYFWMNMAPWGKPNEYRLLGSVGTRKNISAPRAVTVKVNKAGTEAKYDEMLVAGYLRTGDKLFVNGNEYVTKGSRGKVCPSKDAIPTTQLVSTYTLEKDVAYPDTLDLVQELAADQLKIKDEYRQNLIKQFRFAKLCATLIDNEYSTSNGYPIHNPKLQDGVLVAANPEYRDGIEIARISTKVDVNIEWEPLDKPLKMTGTKNSATQTGSVTVVVPQGTPNNAEVVLFNDAGVEIARKTIAGEVTEAGGRGVTFDFGGSATLAFASVTNTVQAYIAQNQTGDGVPIDISNKDLAGKDKRVTEKVTYSFVAPVVTSATRDINGNIEISGTAPAGTEAGTVISIKNAAGVVIGTAEVKSGGTWSLSTTAEQIGTDAPAANTEVSAAMGTSTGPGFTVVPKPVPVSDVVAVRNPATGVTSITATADAPAGTPVSISLPDGTTLTGEVGADGKIGPLTTNQFNAGAAVTVKVSDGTYSGSASGTVTEQAVPAQTPTPVISSAVVGTDGGLTVTGTVAGVAEGTPVVIKDAEGHELATAETDAEGNFTLTQTAEQLGENAPEAADQITAVATEEGKEPSEEGTGTVVKQLPAPTKVEGVRSADGSTLTVNVTVDPNTPDGAVVQVLDPSDPTKVLGSATYSANIPGAVSVPLTGADAAKFPEGTKVPVNVAPGEGAANTVSSTATEGDIKDQTPTPVNVTVTVLPDGTVVVAGEVPGAADGTTVDVTLPNGDVIKDVPVKDGKFDSSATPFTPTSPVEPGGEASAVATDGKAPSQPGTGTVVKQLPAPTKVEGVRSADGETVTVSVTVAEGTPEGSVVQVVDPNDPSKVIGTGTYTGGTDPVTVELTGDAATALDGVSEVPVQVAPGEGAANTVSSTATEGGIKDQTPTPTNVTVTVLPDGSVVVAGEVPGAADGTTVDVTLPNGDVIKDVPVKDGKFDSSATPFTPTSPVEPGIEGVTAVATDGEKAPSEPGAVTVNGQLPVPTKVEGVRSTDGKTVTVSVTVAEGTPEGSVVQVVDPNDPTKVLGFVTYPGGSDPVTVELTGDAATTLDGVSEVPVRVAPGEGAANTVASEPADGTVKDQTPTPTNVAVTVLPDGTVVVAGEVPGTVGTTTVDITLPSGDVIEDVPVKDGKFDTSDKPITPKSTIESGATGVTAVATEEGKAPSEPAGGLVNGKLPAPTKVEGTRSADGKTMTVNVMVAEGTPAGSVVQVLDPSDPTKVIGTGTYTGGSDPVTVELTGEPTIAFAGKTEVPVKVAPAEGATNVVASDPTKGDIKDQTPTPANVTVTVLPDGTVVVAGEVPGAADGTTVDVTLPNGDVIEDVPVKDGKFDTSSTPFTPSSEVVPGGEATAVATEDGKVPSEVGTSTVVKQLPAPTKVEGTRSPDSKTVTVKVTVDPKTPVGSSVQVLDPVTGAVLEEITYTGGTDPVTITLTSTDAAKFTDVSKVPVRVAPDANTQNTVPSASTEGTVAGPVASATLTTDKNFAEGPVVAGTDVKFTYTPVDANGNVVDMGDTVDLTIPGSTQPLKLQRQADGTYKGKTQLTTATPNNGADADKAKVIVTSQPNADARTDVKVKADVAKNVTATVTSDYAAYGVKLEDPADFGDPATVTYTVTDEYGNPADLPDGTTITATATTADGATKVGDAPRTKLGTYIQKVQLQITGPRPQDSSEAVRTLTLTPSVDGLTVRPVELHYTSPPVNTKPKYSNYTVEPVATDGDKTVYANGADQYKITVKLGAHDDKDPQRWVDQVIKGRAPALSVTGLREGDTVTSFHDNKDGTYTAYVTSTVPGAPDLVVNVSDSPLTATEGSATPKFAPQVIDPTKSEFTTSAPEVTPGDQVTFTYTPKDPHGQPIPATSPVLKDKSFTTSPLADGTTVALTPTAGGTFAGIYTPEAPAVLTNVTPQDGGKDVGPAAPLTVTPGTFNAGKSDLTFLDTSGNPLITPVTAGTEVTLKFVPRDDKGYPLGGKVNNADTVSVSVTGIDKPVVLTWSDTEQAYVSKSFKQTKAGSNTATGIGDIAGVSAEDTVTSAVPHHVTWSGPDADTWNQGTVPASTGDTVAIPPVTVVDEFGNPVAPGTEVTVTTPDGTTTTVKVGDNGTLPLDPSITLPTTPGDVQLTLKSGTTILDTVTFTVSTPTATSVTVTTAEIGPDGAVTITGIAPVAKGSPVKVTLPNGTTLTGTVTDDEGHFTLTGTPEQGEGLRGGDPITVTAIEDGQEITGSGMLTKVLDEPGVTASEATDGTVTVVVELPEGTPVGTVVTVTDADNNPLGTVTVDGDGPVTVEIPAEKATGVDTVTVGLDVPADSHTTGPKPVTAEVAKAEVPAVTTTPAAPAATTTPAAPEVPAVPVTVPDMPGGSEVVADPYNVAVVPTDNGATVNGETTPGATVTVTLPDGSTVTGTADADGSFSVDVPGVKAGDTLKVQASKDGTTSNVVTVTVPGATSNRGVLAMTGASSQVVALAAAVLVAGGFILLAATRRRKEEN